jgi:hypothetical protein
VLLQSCYSDEYPLLLYIMVMIVNRVDENGDEQRVCTPGNWNHTSNKLAICKVQKFRVRGMRVSLKMAGCEVSESRDVPPQCRPACDQQSAVVKRQKPDPRNRRHGLGLKYLWPDLPQLL